MTDRSSDGWKLEWFSKVLSDTFWLRKTGVLTRKPRNSTTIPAFSSKDPNLSRSAPIATLLSRITPTRTAYILAAIAVVLPLLIMLLVDRSQWGMVPDTPSYLRPGVAFWERRGYSMEYFGRNQPEMHRTPVYPLILGASQIFLGTFVPLLLLQCLARGAIVLAVAVACSTAPDRLRLAMLALVALDPLAAVTATQLQTETISSLVLAVCAVCLLRHGVKALLIGAFLLGLSVLVRPVNIVLLPLGAIALFAVFRRQSLLMVVGLTLMMLCPTLWMTRNAIHAGSPVLSLTGSNSLYHYRAAGIVAEIEGRPLATVQSEFRSIEESEIAAGHLTPWEAAGRRTVKARRVIGEHPAIYAKQWAKGLAVALAGPGRETWNALAKALGVAGLGMVFTVIAMAHLMACYLFVGARLIRGRWGAKRMDGMDMMDSMVNRHRWEGALMPALLLAAFLLPIMAAAGPEAYSRFRVPLMALLILAAGRWERKSPDSEEPGDLVVST